MKPTTVSLTLTVEEVATVVAAMVAGAAYLGPSEAADRVKRIATMIEAQATIGVKHHD